MKTTLAPQIRTLPVKWEKENPIELIVLGRAQARTSNPRTIILLHELQSRQLPSSPAPRRVSG